MITVDANHELAGKTLHFEVEILEAREASQEEIAMMEEGCGCGGCGGCGGGCGDGCGGDCGCGSDCNGCN
jgi:FKBP-type peptidyl-prolyl cis-trans isomerase SlyD